MNVRFNKSILVIFLLFLIYGINLVYSFNICGVDISEPWFTVKNSSQDLFIVDHNGNVYMDGKDHISNNYNSNPSIKIGSMFFNSISSNFNLNNFHPNEADLSSYNGLVIKNNLSNKVAVLTTNSIYTKGKGVFQGSQSNCLGDGNYCNNDIVETRDYFCNLISSKSGACSYSVKSSIDCSTKSSTDTDGGINYLQKGSVSDFTTCSPGSGNNNAACIFNSYIDSCSDSNSLIEYYTTGSSHNQISKNCNDYEYNYCVGNSEVWRNNWGCGVGKCKDLPDTKIINCPVSANSPSSWSCSNNYQRVRTMTTYTPTCSGATCGQSSSSYSQYESAPSGYYCSGGNFYPIKNCAGYWDYNYGSCSASCGGGNYDKKWITTQSQTPGGTACPNPSFYDNGGNRCNTQSCNCPNGNVYISAGGRTCYVYLKPIHPPGSSFIINCRYHSWDNRDNTATASCTSSGSWSLTNKKAWGYYQNPYRSCSKQYGSNDGTVLSWVCK